MSTISAGTVSKHSRATHKLKLSPLDAVVVAAALDLVLFLEPPFWGDSVQDLRRAPPPTLQLPSLPMLPLHELLGDRVATDADADAKAVLPGISQDLVVSSA